jgi:hypothetical protein
MSRVPSGKRCSGHGSSILSNSGLQLNRSHTGNLPLPLCKTRVSLPLRSFGGSDTIMMFPTA